jgi:peptide/nickel transport system substrate-binding protein
MRNSLLLIACILFLGTATHQSGRAAEWVEPPYFADAVAKGALPAIAERIPASPRVIDIEALGRLPGEYGGSINMLMGKQKDVKMMVVYGYARLVAFDETLNLVPDILERYEVEEGRIFTFTLREGHKWSDGTPFTTEDFRYFWEDMANNEELSPGGPERILLVDGQPPVVEFLSETVVRFTWQAPNPEFLPALAGASPLFICAPAHYLKQFHQNYRDKAELDALVAQADVRSWVSLHTQNGRQYRPENPELPTLDPWAVVTPPPSERFVFQRNPYFHRVDNHGHQLP